MHGKSVESQGYLKHLREQPTPFSTEIQGIKLHIEAGVYPPGDLGQLFCKVLLDPQYGIKPGQVVLDYGTGSGLLAIMAAKCQAKSVVATDIRSETIDCAVHNFELNGVQAQITTRNADGFNCIEEGEKFDVIMASLPWENAEPDPTIPLEQSFYDKDFKMRKTLFTNAKKHLAHNAHIFFSYSKMAQEREPIEQHLEDDYTYSICAQETIEGDPHYIYEIKPK